MSDRQLKDIGLVRSEIEYADKAQMGRDCRPGLPA
jgi:uncharacterized protein YjiS (DUF1127 family)